MNYLTLLDDSLRLPNHSEAGRDVESIKKRQNLLTTCDVCDVDESKVNVNLYESLILWLFNFFMHNTRILSFSNFASVYLSLLRTIFFIPRSSPAIADVCEHAFAITNRSSKCFAACLDPANVYYIHSGLHVYLYIYVQRPAPALLSAPPSRIVHSGSP